MIAQRVEIEEVRYIYVLETELVGLSREMDRVTRGVIVDLLGKITSDNDMMMLT